MAEQQHNYLSRHLPQTSTRLLTGADNIELWSTQEIWDNVLLNVNLVISTPQILLEGLIHGFIHLQQIALLVVDEAHHTIGQAPSNVVMQKFYHPLRHLNSAPAPELPHILGMTASPITTKLASMEILERNLDAVCKAPTRQLEEYRSYVHMPEFVILSYPWRESRQSLPIELMLNILNSVDINDDPFVKKLLSENKSGARYKYERVLHTRSTYSMDQLKKLQGNTEHLYCQLGVWATHAYLREVLLKLQSKVERSDWMANLSDEEHHYLNDILREIRELSCTTLDEGQIVHHLSSKAEQLVAFLVAEYAGDVSCVIFVERRSTAFALTRLLQNHSLIQYTVASFVGASNSGKKDNLIDLAELATQKTELEEFRAGKRSIVVATSVMEEGIDVQATNLVIRFDDSKTVRSYIQSRGRARKVASKFVVMRSSDESSMKKYLDWTTLEAGMKARYMDEMRQLQERLEIERVDDENGEEYIVSSTGATLTFGNARSHLEHFCQSLNKVQYEPNPRPTFICEGTHGLDMTAKVILPSLLPAELKEVRGLKTWRTEKAAKRDAAYVAFVKIHQKGLVNDHLLPPPMPRKNAVPPETRAAFANIRSQINPWRPISTDISSDSILQVHQLELKDTSAPSSSLFLLLPTKLRWSLSVPLYYTQSQTFKATVVHIGTRVMSKPSRALAQEITLYLMRTALIAQSKNPENWSGNLPFYLLPNVADLGTWFEFSKRTFPLSELLSSRPSSSKKCVALRSASNQGTFSIGS